MPPVSDWNLNYQSTSEAQRLNTIAAVKLTYKINLLNFLLSICSLNARQSLDFHLRIALGDISIILVRNL
jgi:hypothetical protein